jgi:hypothetical protein
MWGMGSNLQDEDAEPQADGIDPEPDPELLGHAKIGLMSWNVRIVSASVNYISQHCRYRFGTEFEA